MRKTYSRLFLAALLSTAGISIYAEEPSQAAPIHWETYKHQAMAFSMQKPMDWKMFDHKDSVLFSQHVSTKGAAFMWIKLIETDYLMNVFLSDDGLSQLFLPGYRKTSRLLDGIPATQIEGSPPDHPNAHAVMIVAKSNGRIYELNFGAPDNAAWKDYNPIFQTMLASFEFSH